MHPAGPDKTHRMSHLNHSPATQAAPAEPTPPGSTAATALPSQDLLRGHKTVVIEHNGTAYRLQSTRAGKLILTK